MNSDPDNEHLRDAFASEANWSLDVPSGSRQDRRRPEPASSPQPGRCDHRCRAGNRRSRIRCPCPPTPRTAAGRPGRRGAVDGDISSARSLRDGTDAQPAKQSSPTPMVGSSSLDLPQRARDAYFAQTPKNDCCSQAAQLASLWQVDVFDAKALAGQIVLDGGSLSDVTSHNFDDSTSAFFQHGYTITDAEQLAALWQEPAQILSVKAVAGRMLLDGKALPISAGPVEPGASG